MYINIMCYIFWVALVHLQRYANIMKILVMQRFFYSESLTIKLFNNIYIGRNE